MRRPGNREAGPLATPKKTTHQAPISALWGREWRRKPSSWRGFLVALILSVLAYYGALWLIRKGDPLGWQKGLGRTKKVEQWGRMGRGLDDYQGDINRKKTTQKHAKLIRIFTDRSVPAIGTFRHRSRGRGALALLTPQHQPPGGGVHRTSGEGKGAAQPHSQRPCAA